MVKITCLNALLIFNNYADTAVNFMHKEESKILNRCGTCQMYSTVSVNQCHEQEKEKQIDYNTN